MSSESGDNVAQIIYLPRDYDDNDLRLASELLVNLGIAVLWVAWNHAEGPVRNTGPFPYDVGRDTDDPADD